jgi:hypothetical protein
MRFQKCSVLPFDKWKTHVLSATPWITDSTIVQNIVIIADSIIYYIADPDTWVFKTLQTILASWTSSNDRVQHNINTTENKVAVSLHLHHVPQADMLECRLEILSNYSSSEWPAHLNMQPHEWGSVQWCTGKWHIFGGCCEQTILHDIWLVDLWLICIKQVLSYIFQIKTFLII